MKPWIKTGCALFVAFAAVPLVAQRSTNAAEPATQQAPRAGGVKEGVSLHGNWVLDVRDPDGALVRHSEFKNALVTQGQGVLADLLTGKAVFDWVVAFNERLIQFPQLPAVSPLCGVGGCFVVKNGGPFMTTNFPLEGPAWFPTLNIAAAGPNLVLTGSFTVPDAGGGQIERVVTHLLAGPNDSRTFTLATVPTPVPVAQGQIVQFTYTLSFS